MPIELYFGNQLEHLAEKLADHLLSENRCVENVFEAPVVIVPNQNLAKWLQLTVCSRESIVMNVDFQYLEEGLWNMLKSLDIGENKQERLQGGVLKVIVLHVLLSMDPGDSDLKPVADYLAGPGASGPFRQGARAWQLAEKLASLFQEYEFHRSDMIDRWATDAPCENEMEKCQRRLYRLVSDLVRDYNTQSCKTLVSMTEYAKAVLDQSPQAPADENKKPCIHFFGLSQISEFHLKLIGRLSPYYKLIIYALNPSQEFWEDMKTPQEKKWVSRSRAESLQIKPEEIEEGELFSDTDHPLLSAWGKPGRESVRMLCSLTRYDFNACFSPEPPSKDVLKIIQSSILNLSGEKADRQDTSLQITACPSVYREVETVYNSILYNLEQDPDLQMTDIAVLVPDMGAYKPVFDSVFNRNPGSLSYNLVDSSAEKESAYAQGVLGLLALARGRFSRKEVFDLMMNPCFMSRWNIGPDTVKTWASWAEALGVFHAFDREDKSRRGYAPSDSYTWKQGLQRLRLGRLMALDGKFSHFAGLVPFADIHSTDRDLLDTFCIVVETLNLAVQSLTATQKSCETWKSVFLALCDSLFHIPDTLKGEMTVKKSLIQAFDTLMIYDTLPCDGEKPSFDLELICEYIKAHIGTLAGGTGDYLTSGVTISALQPMRPIPFSIVYILGMEEGNFPGRSERSSLDLRLVRRRIGDISTPEKNSYLFLEILLAVRSKLYISYVARDLQKDRTIQPCSVVNQLRRYVEQDILPEGTDFIITHIPLKGSSATYLGPENPQGPGDVMVNYSQSDRIALLRSTGQWDRFVKSASSRDLALAKRFDPDLSFKEQDTEQAAGQARKISLAQLKKYLEDPVSQSIRYHLGIYDEEETIEDLVLTEDEPFFSGFPADYHLKTEPVELWLQSRLSGEQVIEYEEDRVFDLVYDHYSRQSKVPEGAFAIPDRQELKNHVAGSISALSYVVDLMLRAKELYRAVVIGDQTIEGLNGSGRSTVQHLPPVRLTIPIADAQGADMARDVEISGGLPWLWKDEKDSWHVLILTGSKNSSDIPNRYALGPVLFFMFLLTGEDCARWTSGSALTVHALFNDTVSEWAFHLTEQTSKDYVTLLVKDYLEENVAPWLPFETVSELLKPMRKNIDGNAVDMFNQSFEEAFREIQDPMILLFKPEMPDPAFMAAEKRFNPFLPVFSEIRTILNAVCDQTKQPE